MMTEHNKSEAKSSSLSPARLDDKVAIVTGAAGGFGLSIARTFARNGAHVLMVDVNIDRLETVAQEMLRDGCTANRRHICSIAGHYGGPAAAYGASKWGLLGLTKSAAMEFVDWKIRVQSSCCGDRTQRWTALPGTYGQNDAYGSQWKRFRSGQRSLVPGQR